MVPHPSAHLIFTLGLFGTVLVLMLAVRNPAIRRRFLFTFAVLLSATAVHAALVWLPDVSLIQDYGWKVEALLLVLATAQALVALAFNPWSSVHTPERAPAIVQDATIALLVAVAAVVTFPNTEFLTTSAIVAAVMGFALQETLGNAFAGLAIQIEKPFRVGHWITVGSHEGSVREITWRATKILTKSGNMVVLPNSMVAREAINNYSEPISPTRLSVDVGYWLSSASERVARRLACFAPSRAARASVAGTAGPALEFRRLGHPLSRAFLGRGLFHRGGRARRSSARDLLRARPARHRDPLADSGRVLARRSPPRNRKRTGSHVLPELSDASRYLRS